jgi:lysozyme
MTMKISENGKKLLAEWEGFETQVYKDVAGLPTIGVGHLLTQDERSSGKIEITGQAVRYSNGITEQQVYDLLDQDLDRFEETVNQRVKVPLEQNQFDALVSFSFNVGVGAFSDSTLLKRLNARDHAEVPNQLRRWVRSGGQVVRGLVNRRELEIQLWNGDL